MWVVIIGVLFVFFFKQKTAYEMRISDWSSDVCSSDLFDGQLASDQREERIDLLRGEDLGQGAARHRARQGGRGIVGPQPLLLQIGRASCRERVCQYV